MPMNHAMGNKRKSAFCRELSVAIRDISRSIEHLRMVRERTMSMTARRQLNESIEQLKMIRAKNRSLFRSKCAVHKKKKASLPMSWSKTETRHEAS